MGRVGRGARVGAWAHYGNTKLMSGGIEDQGAGNLSQRGDEDDANVEVSPLVIEAVGKALQTHFQAIAEMPLPDRFLVLLAELEARERMS